MGFNIQNNLTLKGIKNEYNSYLRNPSIKNRKHSTTGNIICNGRNCENLASLKIEEPVGVSDIISLDLCPDCAKNFKK